jgi:hypothetical protein
LLLPLQVETRFVECRLLPELSQQLVELSIMQVWQAFFATLLVMQPPLGW